MNNTSLAPGAPGIPPRWTSSAKSGVGTSLSGESRVWFTLSHGILNEVYWPSTGRPQIRDLGFLVAWPGGWCEVKRHDRYSITMPEPFAPVTEDAVFGHHAALACHMANEAYFRSTAVRWDAVTGRITS